jgi:hypothetical protein
LVGGLCECPSLGTRDRGAGPRCPHDAASLREALRQTKQDRRGGC